MYGFLAAASARACGFPDPGMRAIYSKVRALRQAEVVDTFGELYAQRDIAGHDAADNGERSCEDVEPHEAGGTAESGWIDVISVAMLGAWLVPSVAVNDVERLERFAIMSGLAPQSVDAIRPDFPRWVGHMREHGVTQIPDSPLTGDSHAVNMASMLIRQKARFRGDSIAHELRNLTGIRSWKI